MDGAPRPKQNGILGWCVVSRGGPWYSQGLGQLLGEQKEIRISCSGVAWTGSARWRDRDGRESASRRVSSAPLHQASRALTALHGFLPRCFARSRTTEQYTENFGLELQINSHFQEILPTDYVLTCAVFDSAQCLICIQERGFNFACCVFPREQRPPPRRYDVTSRNSVDRQRPPVETPFPALCPRGRFKRASPQGGGVAG